MSKTTKRRRSCVTKHLWKVYVRHRDYLRTENDPGKVLHMTASTLNVISTQRPTELPDIGLALRRAYGFLNRHQRVYGIPTVQDITYGGTIDN